jgi:hypothetical protein
MQITNANRQTARSLNRNIDNSQAQKALEENRLQEAVDLLEGRASQDPSGKSQALLATALFRQENYAQAAQQYQEALAKDPQNKALQDQLALAVNNRESEVHVDIALNPLNIETLKAGPQPGEAPLYVGPSHIEKVPESTLGKVGYYAKAISNGTLKLMGYTVGAVVGGAVGFAARIFGKEDSGEVWTTWSRKNQVKGLMMLAEIRRNLNEKNLFNTYPEGALTGFAQPGLEQPEWTKYARTADGSWNNADDPMEGAAGTRFGRNINPNLCKVDEANLMNPNPREISRELMTRNEGFKAVPFLNMIAATWIQFQNHDWVSHGDNKTNEFYEIPLAPDDPARQKLHMTHMFVPKGVTDPLRRADETIAAPVHVNEVTHWWDGSQIYGSDQKTQDSLRTHKDGKMEVTEDGRLPVDDKGVEKTGFRRNWWVGLSLLHNLFVNEHNAIADKLKEAHPDWDDQKLFQTARLVNAAVMAKIHTVEWTPAVLPNKMLHSAMNANWYGAATKWLRDPDARKTVAKIDLHDEISGGLVGGKIEKHGVPESRTEEFTAVYRLHPLLPENLDLQKIGDKGPAVQVPLGQTRQAASKKVTDSMEMKDLLYSFGKQEPGQLVLNNYPAMLQDLSVPGFAFFDLAAVDIIRDRERGIPRYNEFRRQFQLNPITQFEDLNPDPEVVAKLKKVYNNDIEKIDLLVGTLAEGHRPENFGFGETMFHVFILNASRRLQDDRFFTTDYNAETYSKEGLEWIDEASMKSVLLRHHPELAQTGLANVENAFEPWDEGAKALDPSRHPLSQYSA